jgi:hypothetical protein
MNALATTPQRQACASTEALARQWAVTFAELFCVSLKERGPRFVGLWAAALADLEPQVLEAACQKAMRTCKFFPMPAEIRALVDRAHATGLALEAAEAWDRLLAWVEEWFYADQGILPGAPALDSTIEHAARAAGGLKWIATCSTDKLQWARKAFIEDFTRVRELGEDRNLLTRGEERRLLQELTEARPAVRALPAPGVAESSGRR